MYVPFNIKMRTLFTPVLAYVEVIGVLEILIDLKCKIRIFHANIWSSQRV